MCFFNFASVFQMFITVLVSQIYPPSSVKNRHTLSEKKFFDDFSGRKGGRKKGTLSEKPKIFFFFFKLEEYLMFLLSDREAKNLPKRAYRDILVVYPVRES